MNRLKFKRSCLFVVYGGGLILLFMGADWRVALGAFMLVWGHQLEKHSS